jgi:integral membrane protein
VASILNKLEAIRPLTEDEAWGLYRIAALSEAGGWTLLIGGILIRHYRWPGSTIAVPITGQIHGMIFLAYFGVAVVTYSSLRWSRRKFLLALLSGVPPYGTLLFEQWTAYSRRNKHSRSHFRSILLVTMASGSTANF